jgi:hypothetical protein
MRAGKSSAAASLDAAPCGLATLGVERDRPSHLTPRSGAAADARSATEGAGGGMRSDLLEARSETLRRLEMGALAPLLCPQTADACAGYY